MRSATEAHGAVRRPTGYVQKKKRENFAFEKLWVNHLSEPKGLVKYDSAAFKSTDATLVLTTRISPADLICFDHHRLSSETLFFYCSLYYFKICMEKK